MICGIVCAISAVTWFVPIQSLSVGNLAWGLPMSARGISPGRVAGTSLALLLGGGAELIATGDSFLQAVNASASTATKLQFLTKKRILISD
jgi:hypothetical protein